MVSCEVKILVLYAHTDKMGIINNARYLEYFEAGRNTLLKNIGYPYTELEKKNYALPVIEANCRYISTAGYDDELTVIASLRQKPSVRIKIEYEVLSNNKIIAKGFTEHSFINLTTMKPVRPPEDFTAIINKFF